MKTRFTYLELSNLYSGLAELVSAGIPIMEAFKTALPGDGHFESKVYFIARVQAKSGKGFSASLKSTRSVPPLDCELIAAAETTGDWSETFKNLAKRYEDLSHLLQSVRSQLVMPALVLTVSLFAAPLPAFMTGEITMGAYLIQSIGSVAFIGALVVTLIKLFQVMSMDPEQSQRKDLIIARIPILGKVYQRVIIEEYLVAFASLFKAGIPINEVNRIAGGIPKLPSPHISDEPNEHCFKARK